MNHEQTIAWWRSKAPTYFTDKVYSFSQPKLIERLEIKPEHYVLELGFGYGRELSQFCKLSNHVYGVELAEETCNLARETVGNRATLQTYDGQYLLFSDAMFHVVYSCFVLQHMSRLSARALIKEALRVTLPRGKVLMEFFGDPAYQHHMEDRFSGDPENGGMYNNGYSWPNVNAILLGLGDILWIESQRVSAEGRTFHNYWACITPYKDTES